MEFRLLGPVELRQHGRRVLVGPAKIQSLLAALLLESGAAVSVDTLVERVWGDNPPANVRASLQPNLSRLRSRIEAAGGHDVRLTHVPPASYRLIVPDEDVDARRFMSLVSRGHAAANRGEAERAIELFQAADALVRGEPLAGLPGEWARVARVGLRERHHEAIVTRARLELGLGHHTHLIGELRELTAAYPLDEAAASLLMRALSAAGRDAEALDVYRRTRNRIREELGLEPSGELRKTHERVLRGDPTLIKAREPAKAPVPPYRAVPNTLERDPPGFVGRDEDLNTVISALTTRLDAGLTGVCVISGMPGIGKTAFALHAAHRLRARYPAGALQISLHGHDNRPPLTSQDALALALGDLGLGASQVQRAVHLDGGQSLWRGETSGRRLLILLDDATDAEQVRSLIPAGEGSGVIVTTRQRLAGIPDATYHELAPLSDADAYAMFSREAGLDHDPDPTATASVIRACAGLPLHLGVAGNHLRLRPTWTIADLAERLAHAAASFDQIDGLTRDVFTTFEASYRDLPDVSRRMFRRLALHAGSEITAHAAAALLGTELATADVALEVLFDHSLITEHARRVYRVHDLLRAYAGRLSRREDDLAERRAATTRLTSYYLAAVDRATAAFHPHRHVHLAPELNVTHLPVPTFADGRDAVRWLDAERSTLLALAHNAFEDGHDPRAGGALSHLLAMYFDRRGLWRDGLALHEKALYAWLRIGDRIGQAHSLADLATSYWRLGQLDEATVHGEAALQLWRELRDVPGQADTLSLLGRIHRHAHRTAKAIASYRRSAALHEELGDTRGLSVCLYLFAVALFEAGRGEEGIALTTRALGLAREINDRAIERNCVNNAGEYHMRSRGDHNEAMIQYRRALEISQELGDPYNIAVAEFNLAEVHVATGNPHSAFASLERALDIFRGLDSQYDVAKAMVTQARAYQLLRKHDQTTVILQQAAMLARQLAEPLLLATVHLAYGALHQEQRDYPSAAGDYRRALVESRRARVLREEAEAHRGLGNALEIMQGQRAARPHLMRALTLYRRLGHTAEAERLSAHLATMDAAGA